MGNPINYSPQTQKYRDYRDDGIDKETAKRLSNWDYPPKTQNYLEYQSIYDNPKYYNYETGEIYWPGKKGDSNLDGFLNGVYENVMLPPGFQIDRYGGNGGTFFADIDTPIENRAMAPSSNFNSKNVYEIQSSIPVKKGEIAPWFDQPGGGIQYQLDPDWVKKQENLMKIAQNAGEFNKKGQIIDWLLDQKYLKKVG